VFEAVAFQLHIGKSLACIQYVTFLMTVLQFTHFHKFQHSLQKGVVFHDVAVGWKVMEVLHGATMGQSTPMVG